MQVLSMSSLCFELKEVRNFHFHKCTFKLGALFILSKQMNPLVKTQIKHITRETTNEAPEAV